jgi:hypothetical protein
MELFTNMIADRCGGCSVSDGLFAKFWLGIEFAFEWMDRVYSGLMKLGSFSKSSGFESRKKLLKRWNLLHFFNIFFLNLYYIFIFRFIFNGFSVSKFK